VPDWSAIAAELARFGVDTDARLQPRPVSGGDINAAWRLETAGGTLFVKTAPVADFDMFDAEAAGLEALAAAEALAVAAVRACGKTERDAFIALEFVDFEAATPRHEGMLGEGLAALHRCTAQRHGWHRANTIGRTPQHNPWSDDWPAFFRDHRLVFQLELAAKQGITGELQLLGESVAGGLDAFFAEYTPAPSLLHGDLWGGNWAVADDAPILFDPAVYYGDRETDIAMTQLFGGFGTAFYDAYEEEWPLANGSAPRLELYRLYHVLNHLNLFGTSYLGRALELLRHLHERVT